MKRLLISCDDYIYSHKGRFWFKNQEWKEFYDRYLRVFDSIRICNRVVEEEKLKSDRILIENPRIEVYPIPIFHGPFQYLIRFFSVGRAMNYTIEGCDAAILRLPSTVAQRLSWRVMKSKIPYAVEIVFDAYDGAKGSNGLFTSLLWRIIDFQMRRICRDADGVSCVTKHYLQRRYYSSKPNHFTSHYSTLALDKSFFTGPRRYPLKQRFMIAHVDMQIALHGRKGAKEVIDAIALLKNRGRIVDVEFAGDDRDNDTKKILDYASSKGLAGQVKCIGFLSRAELSDYLEVADLLVLPTRAEGLPRVIIEAMAKGLPVVTTPVSGNPELIPTEFLVDYSDVAGIAHKVETLIQSKAFYERASHENYNKALNYEASLLEKRRDAFYSQLYQCIERASL